MRPFGRVLDSDVLELFRALVYFEVGDDGLGDDLELLVFEIGFGCDEIEDQGILLLDFFDLGNWHRWVQCLGLLEVLVGLGVLLNVHVQRPPVEVEI